MGSTRVCGGTCHNAKRSKCRCWCGGVFHGAAGAEARGAFAREFGVVDLPTTEAAFGEHQLDLFTGADKGDKWRAAIDAAAGEG
jgi:hypothetical protein